MGVDPAVKDNRLFDGVIFDLFHTLVDPEDFRPKEFFRWRYAAAKSGVDPVPLEAAMIARAPERLTSTIRVIDQLREEIGDLGGNLNETMALQLDDMIGYYQDLAIRAPRAEILSALQSLRDQGLSLAVLSDINEREIRAWA